MDNVFQGSTQNQTPTQGDDALTTKLAAIVNEEGKQKYADVNTALDALKASQEFIPSLKNQVTEQEKEIATLREQVAKQAGFSEALQQFAAQEQHQDGQPASGEGQVDIASIVQKQLEQQSTKEC